MGRRTYDLSGYSAILGAGFAGACQPHLRPGDLVTGELRTVDHVATPAEKSALGAEGVAAVDMESRWLEAAAAGAGLPYRSVRVVIDCLDDRAMTPATASHYLTAAGSLRRAVARTLMAWP
jgi:nucleoside phosphorylase